MGRVYELLTKCQEKNPTRTIELDAGMGSYTLSVDGYRVEWQGDFMLNVQESNIRKVVRVGESNWLPLFPDLWEIHKLIWDIDGGHDDAYLISTKLEPLNKQ